MRLNRRSAKSFGGMLNQGCDVGQVHRFASGVLANGVKFERNHVLRGGTNELPTRNVDDLAVGLDSFYCLIDACVNNTLFGRGDFGAPTRREARRRATCTWGSRAAVAEGA